MIEKFFKKCVVFLGENTNPNVNSGYSVRGVFREFLRKLKVPFFDKDSTTPETLVPTGWDTTTSTLKRYNPVTDTFIDVPGGGGGISSVVTDGSTITGDGTIGDPLTAIIPSIPPALIAYRATAVSGDFLITDRVLEVTGVATITMNFAPVVGISYEIKNSSLGTVTVDGGIYNIDSYTTIAIPSEDSRRLFFTGTKYIII